MQGVKPFEDRLCLPAEREKRETKILFLKGDDVTNVKKRVRRRPGFQGPTQLSHF